MKTYSHFDTMSLHGDVGNFHDFPRLARESGFYFSLYRGHVDWNKIGSINLDRLIRERDLETLQDVLGSVMSCSLEREYDLKVLDPNFVKLFRLAQLGVDYLQYCRQYLDHCVTVIQEQQKVALQELEQLKKENQQKDNKVHQLQKTLKQMLKSAHPTSHSSFKCIHCTKVFLSESFLHAHMSRRHPEHTEAQSENQNHEIDMLQIQISQLQSRLQATEEMLKHHQSILPQDISTLKSILQSELEKLKPPPTVNLSNEEENSSSLPLQNKLFPEKTQPSVTQQEPQLSVHASGEKVNVLQPPQKSADAVPFMQNNEEILMKYQTDRIALLDCVQQQNEQIDVLRNQLSKQYQDHQEVLKTKMKEMQQQYQADLSDLRSSLTARRECNTDPTAKHPVTKNGLNSTTLVQEKVQAWEGKKNAPVTTESKGIHIQNETAGQSVVESFFSTKDPSSETPTKSSFSESRLVKVQHVPGSPHRRVSHEEEKEGSSSASESSSSSSAETESHPADVNNVRPSNMKTSLVKEQQTTIANKGLQQQSSMYEQASATPDTSTESGSLCSYETGSNMTISEGNHSNSAVSDSRVELSSQVLDGLRENLQTLLERRLRELNVDPEWVSIPEATFCTNMATVLHHNKINAKTHKDYFKIRESIIQEVDKLIIEHSKTQPEKDVSTLNKKKESKHSGSLSLLARLKSSVKSKLSGSSRSSPSSKANKILSKTSLKKNKQAENIYSGAPSVRRVDLSHEYETLVKQEKPAQKESTTNYHSSNKLQFQDSRSKTESLSSSSITSGPREEISVPKFTDAEGSDTKVTDPTVKPAPAKIYSGRSMYANLGKTESEKEKPETHSDTSSKQGLTTSTPIKMESEQTTVIIKVDRGKEKPIPSDIESISEMESDFHDIMESSRGEPTVRPIPQPRTTRSTAELLADVARLRQGRGQVHSTQPVVKSNLKSSLSTGNLPKKRVVFRDEKDGFNSLELGPNSPQAFQRSHSDDSIATSSSGRPVPHDLRGLTTVTTTSVTASQDTDSDWDWDKDSDEHPVRTEKGTVRPSNTLEGKETHAKSFSAVSLSNQSLSFKSTPNSRVAELTLGIEKQIQERSHKTAFGINIAGPSRLLNTSQSYSTLSGSVGHLSLAKEKDGEIANINIPSTSGLQQSHSLLGDTLSDLLLDDFSGS